MTAQERIELVNQIIQKAVDRAGGNWKQGFRHEAEEIIALFQQKPAS